MTRPPAVVLVVEDETLILLDTVDCIEHLGHVAVPAIDARRALELLKRRTDITHLFTDVNLRCDIDGIELAAAVQAHWPHISILITSGHMLPATARLASDIPFLPKPYTAEQIQAWLE
ncbi:response regulator [Nitratireductor aestuarii]|uniref:Response regulator n=1 Tax=Nitratireductor aestuarii TaxID=1735103 RepID=A0A916W5M9_9HYPH|nr:response regulator [Nitratireductor aestuarii]GGA68821.1 response regulator [Nitratireductor aestuarii]